MNLSEKKFLIVHQDEGLIKFIKEVLIMYGVPAKNIGSVVNAGLAKTYLGWMSPDIIIIQIGYKELIGPAMVEYLEKNGIRDQFKVLFVSGGDPSYAREHSRKSHADGWLSTPFGKPGLIHAIQNLE